MVDASSEERNEAPSPRRIQQARRTGQVAISRDLCAAFAITTAFAVLIATAQAGVAIGVLTMREALEGATRSTAITDAMRAGLKAVVLTLTLPLCALLVMACLVGLAQGLGVHLPLRPDVKRILPSLRRMFGRDRAFAVGKGLLSLAILVGVIGWSIRPVISAMAALGGASAAQVLHAVGTLGQHLGIRLALAMLALGVGDYLGQRYRYGKALRMSRDEVKREHKESEGEPAHKAERFRLHRELMQEQAISNVKRADLVVIHSDGMAVAIRIDRESAPVVMVKGERRRARSIEEIARTAGVPVFVEPDLCHDLVPVEEGDEIPERLFEQVAELLVKSRTLRRPPN
jgi:flagellar biosynthesis protein FlhB